MSARTSSGRWFSLLAAVLLSWTSGSVVHADVVLDGSLGASGPLAGPDFAIDAVDGRTIGTNLFHSFSEFNLSSSQSATFSGPSSINNVLGRVTGGSTSSIDGLLRSTIPNANLFLVNPHGLMFGPNASLDVQGSFHASTSDYIGLADGTQFTALPSAQDALLTTATPSAFGFLGNNPGSIDIDHSQLAVPQGETLSLVGGDIAITGTNRNTDSASLTAESGTINLVSVDSPGEATFTSPLNADGFSNYGDITVTESRLELSGARGGAAYIRGGEIVFDSSYIFSDGTGDEDGGDITFKGDNVLAHFDGIRDRSGAPDPSPRIQATTSGAGSGGDVRIEADSLTVSGGYRIKTHTFGPGRGGDIHVNVERFEFRDSAGMFAETDGSGRGGDFHLNADSIVGIGFARGVRLTGLDTDGGFFDPDATGDAGDMLVTANTVELEGDIEVGSFTAGQGRGGNLVLHAERVLLREESRLANNADGPSDGGNVELHVGHLEIRSGATISSGTFNAEGNAGNTNIQADSILISHGPVDPDDTGTNIIAISVFGGDAGNIDINTGSLEMQGVGHITSQSIGQGRGGDITITADSVRLDGNGVVARPEEGEDTFISATAVLDDSGPAGNIDINAGTLVVRGGAAIDASTASFNPGGTITVDANTITVETQGRIDTLGSGSGASGDIDIRANTMLLASGGNVTAENSGSGLAGDITISVSDSFQSDGGFVSTEALTSDGGNITVNAPNLVHLTNSAITTSVQGGAGAGGNITIDPQFVILNNSNITANAFGGPGGNIRIVAGNFFATPNSVIQASSAQSIDGTVEIDSPDTDIAGSITALPESFLDASALLPQHCAARNSNGQSSFVVAGRGGTPIDPDGYLPSFHAAGLTTLSASTGSMTNTAHSGLRANNLALLNLGCR